MDRIGVLSVESRVHLYEVYERGHDVHGDPKKISKLCHVSKSNQMV